MDISFIIINYKSEHFLKKCILTLNKLGDLSCEIIIVNNEEQKLNGENFESNYNLNIINCQNNLGFAKACNLGAHEAKGDILFFLNPDTEFLDGDIEKFIQKLQLPGVGIISPRLITIEKNVQQWSCGYETSIFDIIRNNLGFPKSKILWEKNDTSEVDWVSGAALLIKRDAFRYFEGFDEKFFMYFEDADLCKRVRAQGKKILLIPSVRFLHFGGQSYDHQKKQKQQYYQSQYYYFQKHFGKKYAEIVKFLRRISEMFQ